jgi:hypothetical protein
MIPRTKLYRISFFDDAGKRYASIEVYAPTKLLARLNALHDARIAPYFIKACCAMPSKITYGIVRK